MSWVYTNIYIFILAIFLAILEIQIEGPNGWAKNLPTWRPQSKHWFLRFYRKLMSDREATGYHMVMFTFVLLIFHLPYVFGLTPTWEHWVKTLSFFLMFVVLWDFLWFVLNPHYPLKRFKAEHIWWHKKWWGGAPADYYGSIILSNLILWPYIWHADNLSLMAWWWQNLLLFIVQTIIVILFTLYILKIDNWHFKK
ncbi:MAG: hypothetical protein WC465_02925 [Patescibacteria group bacterium]